MNEKSPGVQEKAPETQKSNEQPEFSLDELTAIFGTPDPKILFHRDYCNDFGGKQ